MIRNVSWALRGNVFYAASQGALLIVLAKLGGPEVVGRYTLGLAITAPIILFSNLQLRSLLASDVGGAYQFRDYVGLRTLTNAVALLAIGLVVLAFGYNPQQAIVIMLIGFAKVLESSSDVLYGLMQKSERMDLVGISKGIRGAVTVFSVALALYLTHSLAAGMVSLVVVWFLVLVVVDHRNAFKLAGSRLTRFYALNFWEDWPRKRWLALAWQALPLGIVSMLMSYNSAIPRYFLECYHGETTLGYFSAIAYLAVAITITVEALGQVALPRLAKYHVDEPQKYWRLLLTLSAAALVLGCLGVTASILIGKPLLELVYSPSYGQYTHVFLLIMMLGTLESLCSVLGVGLTAARILRFQVPVLITALAVNALACWWFVPQYGMIGAAWAAIIGTIVWVSAYALAIGCFSWRSTRDPITSQCSSR